MSYVIQGLDLFTGRKMRHYGCDWNTARECARRLRQLERNALRARYRVERAAELEF
jgi:hypothetical protein